MPHTTETETPFTPQAKKRNVIALGFVSMLNDIASEMIYPIVPIFLTTVLGAPTAFVGLIEGVAESTASILKVFSGWFSDKLRNRKNFVTAGYLLSALSKAVLALANVWTHVLAARFMDRFGKGVRTAARDALIADSSDAETRGASFGLHRALDSFGAVIGPLLGLLMLYLLSNDYSLIFLLAAIPGLFAVLLLILAVREPQHHSPIGKITLRGAFKQMNRPFKIFLLVNVLFALGNSSDAFLILRSQNLGYSTQTTVLLYVLFNIFYSFLSYPFGKLSDRFGQKPILIASFLLFAAIYSGFGFINSATYLWLLFPLYGLYMAMSDGVGKAYIAQHIPKEIRGTAMGLYHTTVGVMSFFASLTAGLLWQYLDVSAPFYLSAALAVAACILFFRIKEN